MISPLTYFPRSSIPKKPFAPTPVPSQLQQNLDEARRLREFQEQLIAQQNRDYELRRQEEERIRERFGGLTYEQWAAKRKREIDEWIRYVSEKNAQARAEENRRRYEDFLRRRREEEDRKWELEQRDYIRSQRRKGEYSAGIAARDSNDLQSQAARGFYNMPGQGVQTPYAYHTWGGA